MNDALLREFSVRLLVQFSVVALLSLGLAACYRRSAATRRLILTGSMVVSLLSPTVMMVLHLVRVDLFEIPLAPNRYFPNCAPELPVGQPGHPAIVKRTGGDWGDDWGGARSQQLSDVSGANLAAQPPQDSTYRRSPLLNYRPLRRSSEAADPRIPGTAAVRFWTRLLLATWSTGTCWLLIGTVVSCFKVQRILGTARDCPDHLDALRRKLQCDLNTSFQVRLSPSVGEPVVAGMLTPVVLFPVRLVDRLSLSDLRTVLLHEAGHIMKRDLLVLGLQRVFLAMFWFHPLAHLLVGSINRAREEVCDNLVLQRVSAPDYAETLLAVARYVSAQGRVALGVGLFSARWSLERRISGLLDKRRNRMTRASLFATGIIVPALGFLAFGVSATRVSAQSPAVEANPARPQPSDSETITRVNGEAITLREVAERLLEQHGKDAVEGMVLRRLIAQECARQNVTVTQQEVLQEVEKTAARFELPVAEWYARLEKGRNISPRRYHEDVIWPTIALRKLVGDAENYSDYIDLLRSSADVEYVRKLEASPIAWSNSTKGKARPSAAIQIATVDVGHIYKHHTLFQSQTSSLKLALEKARAELQVRQQEMRKLQGILSKLDTDSEAANEINKLIDQKQLEVRRLAESCRKQFQQREASAYLETYKLIYKTIHEFAVEKGFELVLKKPSGGNVSTLTQTIHPANVNPKDTQAVLQSINQHVLYIKNAEAPTTDITEEVLKRLNEK